MNIGIMIDASWDNIPSMLRRCAKLPPDYKLHTTCTKGLKNIDIISRKCSLSLFRHSHNTVSESMSNILSVCDFYFFFHNMIEYNTTTSVAIEACKENDIPYFVFTEYTKDFFFNGEKSELSMSKLLKTMVPRVREKINISNELLNDVNCVKYIPSMDDCVDFLRDSYEENKKTRQVISLYDKGVHKEEKLSNKVTKSAAHLEFANNRINYYKKK